MANLPHGFLLKLEERTGIKTPNLCRYLLGHQTPKPNRASLLSYVLKQEGIDIMPEQFIFDGKSIKQNILAQLEKKKKAKRERNESL